MTEKMSADLCIKLLLFEIAKLHLFKYKVALLDIDIHKISRDTIATYLRRAGEEHHS